MNHRHKNIYTKPKRKDTTGHLYCALFAYDLNRILHHIKTLGNDIIWQLVTHTYTVTIENIHPNDGIVTLPTQLGWAGAATKTIPNTNHEEVKRSILTVNYLNNLFQQQTRYFKLAAK